MAPEHLRRSFKQVSTNQRGFQKKIFNSPQSLIHSPRLKRPPLATNQKDERHKLGGSMNKLFALTFTTTLTLAAAVATASAAPTAKKMAIPHLDLQMTGREYSELLQQTNSPALPSKLDFRSSLTARSKVRAQFLKLNAPELSEEDQHVEDIIKFGQRNLAWLDYMNSKRQTSDKIRFTRPGDLRGIPIEKASRYSGVTAIKDFADWSAQAPASMVDILVNGKAFTDDPPVELAQYIEFGRKADRVYQTAARWKTMKPWLPYLEENAKEDVRGYYFLNKETDLENELKNWSPMDAQKQASLKAWLVNICFNDEKSTIEDCTKEFDQAVQDNQVFDFYGKYNTVAQKIWNNFFVLPTSRTDVKWTDEDPSTMWVPFITPATDAVFHFIKDNIEDEWKTSSWALKLNFLNKADVNTTAHVEFQPGVTPHVNGLAGNTITMDANLDLGEWDNMWTIRHEFGHVIGFPDCYVEFYDAPNAVIVNYQLDTTNMMCSRAGRFLPVHYNELQRVYYRAAH